MALKFYGSRQELKSFFDRTGLIGDWKSITPDKISYRFFNGAIVNWWPTTKSLQIQGPKEAKDKLMTMIQAML